MSLHKCHVSHSPFCLLEEGTSVSYGSLDDERESLTLYHSASLRRSVKTHLLPLLKLSLQGLKTSSLLLQGHWEKVTVPSASQVFTDWAIKGEMLSSLIVNDLSVGSMNYSFFGRVVRMVDLWAGI